MTAHWLRINVRRSGEEKHARDLDVGQGDELVGSRTKTARVKGKVG